MSQLISMQLDKSDFSLLLLAINECLDSTKDERVVGVKRERWLELRDTIRNQYYHDQDTANAETPAPAHGTV